MEPGIGRISFIGPLFRATVPFNDRPLTHWLVSILSQERWPSKGAIIDAIGLSGGISVGNIKES